jgi:hypothetical protein
MDPVNAANAHSLSSFSQGQQACHGMGYVYSSNFIGASYGGPSSMMLAKDQAKLLISNDDEVKQDGQSFHLTKTVSGNAPVVD